MKMGNKALQMITRKLFKRLFDSYLVGFCTTVGKDTRPPLDLNKRIVIASKLSKKCEF